MNKVLQKLINLIYVNRTLLVFELNCNLIPVDNARLKKEVIGNNEVKLFLNSGEEEIHYSYLKSGTIYCKEIDANILTDSIYMYRCFTSKKHRRKGIYNEALKLASQTFPDKKTYISVLSSNEASINAIMKQADRMCGVCCYQRYFYFFKVRRFFFDTKDITLGIPSGLIER